MPLFGSKGKDAKQTVDEPKEKKGLYARFTDARMGRDKVISDEDLKKYTGKTRSELDEWSKTAPDVAGNRVSGTVTGQGPGGATAPTGYLGQYEAKRACNGAGEAKEAKVIDDDDSVIS